MGMPSRTHPQIPKDDRGVVPAAADQIRHALVDASADITGNRDVALAAIGRNRHTFEDASADLKDDPMWS